MCCLRIGRIIATLHKENNTVLFTKLQDKKTGKACPETALMQALQKSGTYTKSEKDFR